MKLADDELCCLMCGKILYLEYRNLRIDKTKDLHYDDTGTSKTSDNQDEEGWNGMDSSEKVANKQVRDRRTSKYYSTMVRQGGLFRN